MKIERETCSSCNLPRYIVNKRYMLCSECNSKRLKPMREKQVRKINVMSEKQAEINSKYKKMIEVFDLDTPHICEGCGKHEGTVALSHSHIISRDDCKKYGMPELIYDKNNVQYLCLGGEFGSNCHSRWEDKAKRRELNCYHKNISYISGISSELYFKYKVEEPININIK